MENKDYEDIDQLIMYKTIKESLPELKIQLKNLLGE